MRKFWASKEAIIFIVDVGCTGTRKAQCDYSRGQTQRIQLDWSKAICFHGIKWSKECIVAVEIDDNAASEKIRNLKGVNGPIKYVTVNGHNDVFNASLLTASLSNFDFEGGVSSLKCTVVFQWYQWKFLIYRCETMGASEYFTNSYGIISGKTSNDIE